MVPSTRTPEGEPNRCPICGIAVRIDPSVPPGDAPCPHCGHLLWFRRGDDVPVEVFTTGQAARLCKVSQQTIVRCFDSGELSGYRGKQSRRMIPRESLKRFMLSHEIPADAV